MFFTNCSLEIKAVDVVDWLCELSCFKPDGKVFIPIYFASVGLNRPLLVYLLQDRVAVWNRRHKHPTNQKVREN